MSRQDADSDAAGRTMKRAEREDLQRLIRQRAKFMSLAIKPKNTSETRPVANDFHDNPIGF